MNNNPHRIYRYNIGGQSAGSIISSYQGGVHAPIPAAKCLCGAEMVGEPEIRQHQAVAEAWKA